MEGQGDEFFVYVVANLSTGRCYVGHTSDVQRRVAEHNSREHNPAKYTSKHQGPWRLLYEEGCASRSEAMRKERWLKSGQRREWLESKISRVILANVAK